MYKYFILQSKKSLKPEKRALEALFSDFAEIDSVEFHDHEVIVVFSNAEVDSLYELSQNLVTEFLLETRLYESIEFKFYNDLEKDLRHTKRILDKIPFDRNTFYLNKVDILYAEISKPLKEDIKKDILKKYYDDEETKEVLKVYFGCNQNTSEASKRLYMHRNTLIQKLDRFYEETGFNPREFKDAVIIYKAIE